MAAVLQYVNSSGNKFERVWDVGDGRKFTALIKCYIKHPGEQNIQTIEKPSTRPATFAECYKFAEKLKREYGANLKQLIVWNIDEIQANYSWK